MSSGIIPIKFQEHLQVSEIKRRDFVGGEMIGLTANRYDVVNSM